MVMTWRSLASCLAPGGEEAAPGLKDKTAWHCQPGAPHHHIRLLLAPAVNAREWHGNGENGKSALTVMNTHQCLRKCVHLVHIFRECVGFTSKTMAWNWCLEAIMAKRTIMTIYFCRQHWPAVSVHSILPRANNFTQETWQSEGKF